jgi:hypothetical protein
MEPKPIVIRPLFEQERERLLALAREINDRAAGLRPGSEQRKLLREARHLETTADLARLIRERAHERLASVV